MLCNRLRYKSLFLLLILPLYITVTAFNHSWSKTFPVFFKQKRVLVFSKTAAFHHGSIPKGIQAIQKLGTQNNFIVDTTTNSLYINPGNLKQYAAVIFLNTTGDIFNPEQQLAFEQYIKNGGGFMGIHAASDTEYDWPWYNKLVGAYFLNHPAQQLATLHVTNKNHLSTKHLPDNWHRKDEWYNFKQINPNVNVLLTIDENTYTGGSNAASHPMAWYHEYDGGRAFYTALGHTDESYDEPLYLQHLLGGIKYAMGLKK